MFNGVIWENLTVFSRQAKKDLLFEREIPVKLSQRVKGIALWGLYTVNYYIDTRNINFIQKVFSTLE